MFITSASEYAAAKAFSYHPNLFPDEKEKGSQPFKFTAPMLICPQCHYKAIIGYEAAKDHVASHFPGVFLRLKKKTICQMDYGGFHPVVDVRNLRDDKNKKKVDLHAIFKSCCMMLSMENPPIPAPLPKDPDDHDEDIKLLSKKTNRK